MPISNLIMEAARRVDECERLRQQVPSFREIYVVDKQVREAIEGGQLEVDVIEKRVISLIDGKRDVDDLIHDTFLFRYEVLSAVSGFLQSSLIRPAALDELRAVTEEIKAAGDKDRLCKNLERRLAMGEDNAEVRRELATSLAASDQADKAVIHFSVLADGALKSGDEDAAVELYRRILQVLPDHLPSRERLGAIYGKRGQVREALVQFQEAMHHYRQNQQAQQARRIARQALELEPAAHEIRRELVEILSEEGERRAASQECEILGDMMARQNQNKEAAEYYRRAMQLAPGLAHLKKKLANVMLTQEDRRARTKRTLILTMVFVAILATGALLALHELGNYKNLQRLEDQVKQLTADAAALEDQEKFKEAADKYNQAGILARESKLARAFGPFSGVSKTVEGLVIRLDRQRAEAMSNFDKLREQGTQNSKQILAEGEAFWKEDNVFKALEKFDEVLNNPFTPPEVREKAKELKTQAEELAKEFRTGLERITKPPKEAFQSVAEEFQFKNAFLRRFATVPEMKNVAIEVPLLIVLKNIDRALAYKDEKFVGPVSRGADNVIRYAPGSVKQFEFRRDGYESVVRSGQGLDSEFQLSMKRKPAFISVLPANIKPSGNACYDGASLWVGTVDGGLVKLTPGANSLDGAWQFNLEGPAGLSKEVFGSVEVHTLNGKKMVLYTTLGGDCIAVDPDAAENPVLHLKSKSKDVLKVPPRILHLPFAGDQYFYMLPRGKRLEGYRVEQGTPLWSEGSADLPSEITAGPLLLAKERLLVVGCLNGKLYGLGLEDGQKKVEWTTRSQQSITAGPIWTGKRMVACAADGSIFFFETGGGGETNVESVPGAISTDPVFVRQMIFFGSERPEGLFGVDSLTERLRLSLREQAEGGLTVAPAGLGNYVYYATEKGHFYALKYDEQNESYDLHWDYRTATRSRAVSRPIAIGKRVFFICADGKIYAFED
ncbi:MAG: PQQ-binding-like beta-propeller repeat protein [Planctomycetota bacterium]|nr:PQQ-binding-like beta-propeller repeat protein [Planctomycetota bacterium]